MKTPMDCKDFNVLPSSWETSCTVREVLRMPSRHLVVSSSPQFTLNRYKSEGATSMMRAKSGQSLQTHSGIAQPGLQVRERVKERAGACIRRGKRERLEGCRRRNASVGRSDCVQRANGEDHTSDGGGPAG